MSWRPVLPLLTAWKNQVRSTRTREQQVLRRPGSYSLQYVFIAYLNLIVTIHIRVESNDSSWSTFVGCQGVACRALMIGSPRCSRGWTNGNRLTSTWSIQQDHTQTAPLGLTSPGTYPGLGLVWFMLTLTRSHTRRGLRMAMPGTTWRH